MATDKDFIIYDYSSRLDFVKNLIKELESEENGEQKIKLTELTNGLEALGSAIDDYNRALILRDKANKGKIKNTVNLADVSKALIKNVSSDQAITEEVHSPGKLDEQALNGKVLTAEQTSTKALRLLEEVRNRKKLSPEQKALNEASKHARALMKSCVDMWEDLGLNAKIDDEELNKANTMILELNEQIDTLTIERDTAISDKETAQEAQRIAEENADKANNKAAQAERDLNAERMNLQILNDRLIATAAGKATAEEKVNGLDKDLTNTTEKLNEVNEKIETLTLEKTEATEELTKANEEIASLRAQLLSETNAKTSFEIQNAALQARLDERSCQRPCMDTTTPVAPAAPAPENLEDTVVLDGDSSEDDDVFVWLQKHIDGEITDCFEIKGNQNNINEDGYSRYTVSYNLGDENTVEFLVKNLGNNNEEFKLVDPSKRTEEQRAAFAALIAKRALESHKKIDISGVNDPKLKAILATICADYIESNPANRPPLDTIGRDKTAPRADSQ